MVKISNALLSNLAHASFSFLIQWGQVVFSSTKV
jgi:hypothetical protein